MTQRTRNVLRFGASLALLGGLALGSARADTVLTPGDTPQPISPEAPPPGLTLVASNTVTSVGALAGSTLMEAVFRETNSTFGPNTLDFVFQVKNGQGTNIDSFITGNYGNPAMSGFLTNGGVFSSNPSGAGFTNGTVNPTTAQRGVSGDNIIFDGFTLTPGQTTTTFFVRTNATAFNSLGTGTISGPIVNGQNFGNGTFLNTFEPTQPTSVPEPATFGMAAVAGLFGLGYTLRRRAAK